MALYLVHILGVIFWSAWWWGACEAYVDGLMGQHNFDWWNGKVPVLWLWGSGCSMDLWHHHAFGGVEHGNEVLCIINYSCGCSLGDLEWQDRMIFGWIVGWYPGYKGAVFAYMWNCFWVFL